jgi:hypothetical protein
MKRVKDGKRDGYELKVGGTGDAILKGGPYQIFLTQIEDGRTVGWCAFLGEEKLASGKWKRDEALFAARAELARREREAGLTA